MPPTKEPLASYAARVRLMIAREQKRPLRLWFLSFASPGRFHGGAVVRARGPLTAVRHCHQLGILPKTKEVLAWPVIRKDAHRVPPDCIDRLLRKREIEERLDGKNAWE